MGFTSHLWLTFWVLQELDYIQQVWEITKEWEVHWEEWKNGSFKTLKTEVMENTAFALFRKLNKLSKELKARQPSGPRDGQRGEKVEELLSVEKEIAEDGSFQLPLGTWVWSSLGGRGM